MLLYAYCVGRLLMCWGAHIAGCSYIFLGFRVNITLNMLLQITELLQALMDPYCAALMLLK